MTMMLKVRRKLHADLRIRRQRQALYALAQDKLLNLIHSGVLAPGAQLPSQEDLASMLGVSRATIREAIRGIAQMGLINQRQGVGTFVTAGGWRINEGMEILESLESMGKRQGWVCGSEAVKIEQIPADASLAQRFGVPEGASINKVSRIKTADGQPIASMTDYVLEHILPIDQMPRQFAGSVLDILLARDKPRIDFAIATWTACTGTPEVAQSLRVAPDTPLLFTVETVYADDERIIEIGETYFITNFFRFHVTRRPIRF
jgi:GntR family transcriptional regulator